MSEELAQSLLENAALQDQKNQLMAERAAKEEKEREERDRQVGSASQWSAVTALEGRQMPTTSSFGVASTKHGVTRANTVATSLRSYSGLLGP